MRTILSSPSFRLSALYACITGLWVVFSDRLLGTIARNPDNLTTLQTYKGLLFIVLSSALLYVFSLRELRNQDRILRALAAHEAQTRLITSQMPSILWATDTTLHITQLAGGWSGRVGPAEAVLNRTLADVFTAANQPDIIEAHLQALQGKPTTYEMRAGEDDFEVRVEPLRDSAGAIVGCVGLAVSITERKQAEAADEKQRSLTEALLQTASILTNTLNPSDVMDRILTTLGMVVPHDTAGIMLVEDGRVRGVAGRNCLSDLQQDQATPGISLDSLPFKAMNESGAPLLIADTRQEESWQDLPAVEHIRSYVGAPLYAQGRLIGLLNLCSETPGFFAQEHLAALRLFGAQAAIALENAQLYQQIREYARELEDRVAARTSEVMRVKERVEAIFNSSRDVIILADLDSNILQFNTVFSRVFTCDDANQFVGRPLTALAAPEHATFFADALHRLVETNDVQRIEITVQCGEDARFDGDAVLSPVLGSDQTLQGIVCSIRDITARKQADAHLRETLLRATELNELRVRFVSIASHEFRNPLAAIQTSADLLHRYEARMSDEQKEEEYQRIRSCIKQLVELLDDLLTLGAVEGGRLKFEPEKIDPLELAEQLLQEARQSLGTNHYLEFRSEGSCTCALIDPRLFRYIVNNLLSNAIKYSPPHTFVHLGIACTGESLVLTVTDEGIGIPAEDQTHLFEAFHRGSNVGPVPGTGLGLVIINQAVNVHGGTITLTSRENEGTTFTVTLPMQPC